MCCVLCAVCCVLCAVCCCLSTFDLEYIVRMDAASIYRQSATFIKEEIQLTLPCIFTFLFTCEASRSLAAGSLNCVFGRMLHESNNHESST